MNTLIKLIIGIAVFFAFIGILSTITLFAFDTSITDTTVWLLSSVVPFKGIINEPAWFTFLEDLMIFELAYFSFEIAGKVLGFFHGSTISARGNYAHRGVTRRDINL